MSETPNSENEESAEMTEALAAMTLVSNYKVLGQFTDYQGAGVLGQNDAGSGTPIGVQGAVPNSNKGYGLATSSSTSTARSAAAGTIRRESPDRRSPVTRRSVAEKPTAPTTITPRLPVGGETRPDPTTAMPGTASTRSSVVATTTQLPAKVRLSAVGKTTTRPASTAPLPVELATKPVAPTVPSVVDPSTRRPDSTPRPPAFRPGDGPLIGRAWDGTDAAGVHRVTVAVGIEPGEVLGPALDAKDERIESLESETEQLRERLGALEERVAAMVASGSATPADD